VARTTPARKLVRHRCSLARSLRIFSGVGIDSRGVDIGRGDFFEVYPRDRLLRDDTLNWVNRENRAVGGQPSRGTIDLDGRTRKTGIFVFEARSNSRLKEIATGVKSHQVDRANMTEFAGLMLTN
jgi:hypothetical protein